ncbi:transcriptional regulator, LacI family [Paenibacillus tianmuensis]|uniref:Transcriptional regulator, LacI family n=1 Tax=Paenibacillus tianmuensis TaxID=624147 RepID=A0A1G4QG65_9BACL|nr:LacI family DNA-binding transcriptional regulator [Paenibacillus tianmuensis]SCW43604.1 transcriptional regulator, LacI family [Paenibacillus tianmuensis]
MENKKNPTLYDVAQKANVSITTVSNVLNNKNEASQKTIDRVNEAIRQLGYSRNESARTLKVGTSKLVGLIVPDNNPFFTQILTGIHEECQNHDWQVVVATSEESEKRQNEVIEMLSARQVSGIILASVTSKLYVPEKLQKVPIVLIDREVENANLPVVKANNVEGSYKATETLIQNGHRRIGIILASPGISTTLQRKEGYIQALKRYGIEVDEKLMFYGGDYTGTKTQINGGYQAVMKMIQLPEPPTAIFATNHLLMIGAVKALKEANLKIPDEISFIGFDDHPWQEITDPPFSIISQPAVEMGRQAIQALQKFKEKNIVTTTVLQLELITRNSYRSIT